jgi:hypothetical protein
MFLKSYPKRAIFFVNILKRGDGETGGLIVLYSLYPLPFTLSPCFVLQVRVGVDRQTLRH